MRPIGSIHLLKNGGPTVRRSPVTASLNVGNIVAKRTKNAANSRIQLLIEERRFTRQPRVELVARTQQRQPVDDEAEADDDDRDHEAGEQPRQRDVLAERVHRLHDARPRHERAEDRQEERDDDERDVPDAQHAALLLHHHRVQKRGRR